MCTFKYSKYDAPADLISSNGNQQVLVSKTELDPYATGRRRSPWRRFPSWRRADPLLFHFYGWKSHTNVARSALRRLEYDFDTKTLTPIEHMPCADHWLVNPSYLTPVRGRFFIQGMHHGFINDCRVGSRVHRRGLLRRVFWRLRTVFVQVNVSLFAGDVGHFTHHAQRTLSNQTARWHSVRTENSHRG